MSGITAFDFDGSPLRVLMRDGQPWFVVADVCRVLDITNHRHAADRLDEDEKGVHSMDTLGGAQRMTVINESGLYSLILTSRRDGAKRFRKWVTSEVLPQIRKTGAYLPAEQRGGAKEWRFQDQNIDDLKACISLLREVRLNHGRSAAQRLWGKLAPPLPSIESMKDKLWESGDGVTRFCREMIEPEPGAKLKASVLYEAYCVWCKSAGVPCETWTGFGKRTAVLGLHKKRSAGVWYTDIKLKEAGDVALLPAPHI